MAGTSLLTAALAAALALPSPAQSLSAAPAPKAGAQLQPAPPQPAQASQDVVAATRAWHAERLARLTAEDGWLTLVGLHWLAPGESAVGSAEGLPVALPPGAPARLGTFRLEGGTVQFTPAAGAQVTVGGKPFAGGAVKADTQPGGPDVLRWGSLQLVVLKRGERTGVRVRDSAAPTRKGFKGIPTYPAQARWRVEAKLVRGKEGRVLQVPNVLGTEEQLPSPGTLVFKLDGKEHKLDPVLEGDQLFVIFADETNRSDTYGAGRFLYADAPGPDGRVVLDFNRAYNPPCAFTPYATCPLPPRQNRLKVRVEAGEKRAGDH